MINLRIWLVGAGDGLELGSSSSSSSRGGASTAGAHHRVLQLLLLLLFLLLVAAHTWLRSDARGFLLALCGCAGMVSVQSRARAARAGPTDPAFRPILL